MQFHPNEVKDTFPTTPTTLLQATLAHTARVFCDNMLTQTYLLINTLIGCTNGLIRIAGRVKDVAVTGGGTTDSVHQGAGENIS